MAAHGLLSEQDLAQLRTLGYVKVRAFAPEEAAQMEAAVWDRFERHQMLRDDPSTWGRYPGGLSKAVRNTPVFRRPLPPEFSAVVDQLLGPGRWIQPRDRGMVLYTFPEQRPHWDVADGWHWHGYPLRNIAELRDIFIFFFLNRVDPEGGGTVLVEGSHHLVCQFYNELTPDQRGMKLKTLKRKLYDSHPWLRDLVDTEDEGERRRRFMDQHTDVLGHPLRVVELTGEPGEAYITNMSTMHSRSFNVLDRTRFMTAREISQIDERTE
ncbi:MAG: hypothetical protein GKR89_33300 [Candidatus Latescibacteria bacterium]|nr:hypothetical protein [Candidatus Latescibacterota bacterium]